MASFRASSYFLVSVAFFFVLSLSLLFEQDHGIQGFIGAGMVMVIGELIGLMGSRMADGDERRKGGLMDCS